MSDKTVDLSKKVKGYATKTHPSVVDPKQSMKAGDEFECGEVLLPHLISKGFATAEAPKEAKKEDPKEPSK